ncbi:uncharacterized protein LOC136032101 isoform X1 [Artemia franciscana]|uniref:Uncharacterized protein n=1 Tax=Artemia franciscana TaxID=6661 RepID=A0AA88LBV4_ARTSF|nr:hypothetical protein QYM36_000228 [Artemia franciscana]
MAGKHRLRRTATGTVGIITMALTVILVSVAFSTNYWLENWGDKYYGDKFEKLGLWVHCFRSLPDPKDPSYSRFFNGCRWVFTPFTTGYAEIRDYLMPPFFIAVQTFFTFCFICMLIALGGTAAYVLCFTYDYQVFILQALGWVTLTGGACGFIAVVVFGALGDSRDWMPNYEHNFLSWSFALAVVGTYGMIMTSVLFFVEAKIQRRKIEATESNATFALDHPVKS